MQANGSLGDGKAQARSAGEAVARITHAIKRQENVAQRLLGDAASAIANGNYGDSISIRMRLLERDLDFGALIGVADRVADYVFDCAAQELAISEHRTTVYLGYADATAAALRFKISVGGDIQNHLIQRDQLALHTFAAAFNPRQPKQAAN